MWFVIRSYGVTGLQAFVREHLRLAQLFKGWVERSRNFELLAPVHFGVVCFRLNDGRDEESLNRLNKALMDRLNATGEIYLTHTTLGGKYTLRFVVGQRTTQERHVRHAWDLIASTAEKLMEK